MNKTFWLRCCILDSIHGLPFGYITLLDTSWTVYIYPGPLIGFTHVYIQNISCVLLPNGKSLSWFHVEVKPSCTNNDKKKDCFLLCLNLWKTILGYCYIPEAVYNHDYGIRRRNDRSILNEQSSADCLSGKRLHINRLYIDPWRQNAVLIPQDLPLDS